MLALLIGNAHAQSTFETPEYSLSKVLKPINASYAYSRGYTGKNSVIAIVDSGIDTSSNQFTNKILYIRDFSGIGTPVDNLGHGTHVAGIAAAAKDGIGMHGVAYDAKLIIGKVTDDGKVASDILLNGLVWASQLGPDVINLSIGYSIPSYVLAEKLMSTGLYKTKFTNTNTLPISEAFNIPALAQAMRGETVLVVAAGNDRTKWSQGLAGLATVTDNSGNLMFGGRVLIAGNYDPSSSNSLNFYSNGAAHLCQTTVKGVMNQEYCADKYKTWEFYIMAPGTNIVSTVPANTKYSSTTLAAMTGTSMAAPVVSGAVAIIHQMWPQMKGSNIVKLLLVTANKSFVGYNLYVHGQGLLDLDRATRPIGNLGIPTTGRLSGPSLANVRPLIYTGGSASTGGLTNVMLVDSYQRDFYTSAKTLTATKPQLEFNSAQVAMVYEGRNPYALFNSYTDRFQSKVGDYAFSIYRNFHDINAPYMFEFEKSKHYDSVSFNIKSGFFAENYTWLNNSVGSFDGNANNNQSFTYFTGAGVEKNIQNFKFYSSYMMGITRTNSTSENITHIGNIISNTYLLGGEYTYNYHTLGFMMYKPVTVQRAKVDVNMPVGLDSDFNVIQSSKGDLAATVKEYRLGMYHKFYDSKRIKSIVFVESRRNYQGVEALKDTAVGIKATKYF